MSSGSGILDTTQKSVKTTHRFKGSHFSRARGRIVDGNTAIIAADCLVGNLRHALVRPVARLEVQVRRPVVGEVLVEAAGGAR
jgi:hypothetical protein